MLQRTADLAWVAGLLEGEGSFCAVSHGQKYVYLTVSCSMTDRDVLERLQAVTGVGHVNGPYTPKSHKPHYKPKYQWAVTRSEDSYALMVAIWGFMGERRKSQISEVIIRWRSDVREVPSDEDRFWSHVERRGRCKVWTGYVHKQYGFGSWVVPSSGKRVQAHRFALALAGAEVPARLPLPSCGDRTCVTVEHYFDQAATG